MLVPSELTVRYKGSADQLFEWYRDRYPTLLKTTGVPFVSSTADAATRSVTCHFASAGGNSATFRYSVAAGEESDGEPTAVVRLDTTVKKSFLFGRGFESQMLGLFMTTDQMVGQHFPVVPA